MVEGITDDNEGVRAAFTSPDGLSRISGEEERHVSFPVVMVVTDRRILFVGAGAEPGELGPDAGTLTYDDLAAVGVEGAAPAVLALSMANGVRWEFPLPDADLGAVDAVVRHLHWVGEVRSRLVACRNDLELAAGEIQECIENMAWEAAEDVYEAQRDQLDELICTVQVTAPIPDHVIAPELTRMERTLERSYARLFIERAQSQLELGQQLVENDDYTQARKVLETAQEHYERASDRVEAIERGDAFRFGEQRELCHDLDRLAWEIDAVAAEPLRRAHEAKIQAKNEEDLAVAVNHWENAFRRYGDVLTLEGTDSDQQFAGDPAEIRRELESAAARLVQCHRELARRQWDDGAALARNDAVKSALRACTNARDHIDRALELAEEFQPGVAEAVEQRREQMETALREMRETATVEAAGSDTESESVESPDEDEAGGAERLVDIDTHHELTFDATVDEGTGDGSRNREWGLDAGGDNGVESEETTAGSETGAAQERPGESSEREPERVVESDTPE